MGDDPDAPWRPGYTGPEPKPPEATWDQPRSTPPSLSTAALDPWSREADGSPAAEGGPDGEIRPAIDPDEADRARQLAIDEAPNSDGPGLVGVVGVLVAIGLVVAVVIAVGLLNDGSDETSTLLTIPESVDERWSADVPGVVQAWISGGAVVVRTNDELTGFDVETGDELWARPPGGESALIEVEVAGDVLLLLDRSADALIATGLDPLTGDDLWTRNVAELRQIFELRDRIIEFEFDPDDDGGRFAILSPETGLPLDERLRVTDVSTTPPLISASTIDTDEPLLFDIDTGERIAVPFDVDGLAALTMAGGRLFALSDAGSLMIYDDAGEVVDEIDVTLGSDQEAPDDIFPVPGRAAVVVSAGGSSVGVAVVDDALEISWSIEGLVQLVEQTDDGPRAIVVADERRIERSLIVDPIDGETLFEVESDELLVFGFESQSFGRNGLVYPDDGALVALDASGETLWELDDLGPFVVDDGLLVEFTDDGITVYG